MASAKETRVDIWQMRYFIQIYNDKSLTKAAKNLYISQQGLSKAIKNIEDEFQISLFERSAKGVKPTIYGEILLQKSQKIINDYDEMVYSLSNKVEFKKKTISIGIANILYTDYIKAILYDFQEEYPDIVLEFIELGSFACEKYLVNNLVDICFTLKPDNALEFNFISVSAFDLILMVNSRNSLCQKSVVNIIDLKDEKFIMLSEDYKIRKLTLDYCLQLGFSPNIIITTSQLDLIIDLIDLNKGIAILPEFNSVKAAKMSNNISVIFLEDISISVEVGFIINKYIKMNYLTNALINYFLKAINANPTNNSD